MVGRLGGQGLPARLPPPHSLQLLSHSQGTELLFEETVGNLLIWRTEEGRQCHRGGFGNAL